MTALLPFEYETLLAPCRRPRDVIDRQQGATLELFGPAAFVAAELRPDRVPIVLHHRSQKPIEVGHLTRVWAGSDWIKGTFVLVDSAVGLLAREHLRHGSPVSIEYEPRRTLDRVGLLEAQWHVTAELLAVAVGVERSAYDDGDGGARVVKIRNRQQPRTSRRRDSIDPQAEQAAIAAAKDPRRVELARKGILVRNYGTVLRVG